MHTVQLIIISADKWGCAHDAENVRQWKIGACVMCAVKRRGWKTPCEGKHAKTDEDTEGCTTAMNRIPKEVYQRNARLAKCYYFWLKQRRDIERDILYASAGPGDGMPRGGGNGDPTAAKAEKLIARLEEVDKKIRALQQAMDAMPDEESRVLIRKNLYDHIPLQ